MKTTEKYGKKADLALSLWVKLARTSTTFDKLSALNIKSFGLTEPQFSVLECLGHLGPLTLGTLSKKMLVCGGNTTVVVDNLEKEKLVERQPSKTDRRAILVELTPKGKKLFDEIFIKHAEYITKVSSVLSENEQLTLSQLLKKFGLALSEQSHA
jgi:MarR family transcriptional regulator, 2-MHQ and catechol-resistance regulon repressor